MTRDTDGTNGDGTDTSEDEWRAVRGAASVRERASAMGEIARERARESDESLEDRVEHVVRSYLLRATTDDALAQLRNLNTAYPDAFYNGAANDRIMAEYRTIEGGTEFWYDHIMAALNAGWQWAILNEMDLGDEMREVVGPDWSVSDEHGTSHHVCDCGNRLEWPGPEGCDHWKGDADDPREKTWVCKCGFTITDATQAEISRHVNGITVDRMRAILDAVADHSQYGSDASDYFRDRAWGMGDMSMFDVAREEGYNPRTADPDEIGEAVADALTAWCEGVDTVPAEM